MNLNRVELIGGLTKAPELRFTAGGWPFANFTLAVNDTRYDKEIGGQVATTNFIGCTIWGPNAEELAEELDGAMGEKVYVFGQLEQNDWEDKEGNKKSRTKVNVMMWNRLQPKKRKAPKPEQSWDDPAEAPF